MTTETNVPKYTMATPVELPDRTWPARPVAQAPIWCSVDLRDGNQALPNPMSPEQKKAYFALLCRIGFKHIEVAFPSASRDDFAFTRRLIDDGLIPGDVFIMGLTQCRPHLIEKTFEAFRGIPRGIVHTYIATSDLHIEQVFNMNRAKTLDMAVKAVALIRARAEAMPDSDIRLEFSPEEFTDTDPHFAVDICTAVFETWGRASPDKPMILNLPATVERRPPNQYADMIEAFTRAFPHRDAALVSLHSHNDQGMAVAATEMALMAGADRVEGTLFGHGERTGNVDLVTVANNLASRGIPTGLDFSDLPAIAAEVEDLTGMPVYYRQPYAGELVFTAFSGSHQDAINKGMHRLGEAPDKFGVRWKVPYLHIDPSELGRRFERLIRINSQSGKGGVAWVMEKEYGLEIPKTMQPEFSAAVQALSDRVGREVSAEEVYRLFQQDFLQPEGPFRLLGYWPRPDDSDPTFVHGEVKLTVNGEERTLTADGNGPVSAFVEAVRGLLPQEYSIDDYHEQAIGHGANASAMAYVPLKFPDGSVCFGVGTDTNIDQAAVRAIIAAMNRAARKQS